MEIDAVAVKWPDQHSRDGQPISLLPEAFPYRLNQVQGEVRYRDGQVDFRSLSAVHGNSRVTVSGFCQFAPDGSGVCNSANLTRKG